MTVKRRKRRRLRKIWKNTLFMLAIIGISTLIHLYAPYKIAVVSGSSMEPTLHDRDILRTMACGIAGLSVVADALSAMKYAKVKTIRDEDRNSCRLSNRRRFP